MIKEIFENLFEPASDEEIENRETDLAEQQSQRYDYVEENLERAYAADPSVLDEAFEAVIGDSALSYVAEKFAAIGFSEPDMVDNVYDIVKAAMDRKAK